MFRKLIVVAMVLMIAFNSTSCASKPEKNRYEAEFLFLFDTVTRIIGYDESKEVFTERAQFIHDSLEEYHKFYDIYNDYEGINNIKTINDRAGKAPVKVDQRIIDLLLFSKEAYDLTDGRLNVAMGAVLKIWHDYRTEGIEDPAKAKLPSLEQLKEAAKHVDINKVIIDAENGTVFLEDPAMSLDVGGIAKGYATEQVAQLASEAGVDSALISVGGNVRAIGARGDGTPWQVGVRNPIDKDGANICDVALKDASLVTSGTYDRYYVVDGERYHHIIDPDTLFPAKHFVSVTILCKDSGRADALAKIINMPYEQGLALIESLPGTEALWVEEDGALKHSSGFPIE